jgi:hypothetical protein
VEKENSGCLHDISGESYKTRPPMVVLFIGEY